MTRGSVEVIQSDITQVPADAIVNAANAQLAAGGGVCGAIFRAAGAAELTAACRVVGGCATGAAVITPAFAISTARFIVHAVGPVYAKHAANEARRLLRAAYGSAIAVAQENDCESIAFPAISTGIYGYPLEPACREAVDVCRQAAPAAGMTVKLVAFDATTADCLRAQLEGTT